MHDDATTADAASPRALRIAAILEDCCRRRAAGEALSDDALIAAHPELMPELADEFRKLRLIAAARERAAQPITDEADTRSHQDSDTGSGHLEVRCPNCHQPTTVAVDTQLTDLTCSSCGSHFSLVDQSKATRMAPSLSKMGRFELIERLGVGGFGSVWKARDKELDRTVAIKIARAGGMTPEDQEKFFREARAVAQLLHPSIVSVHEVGRDGDSAYIVSDFVRGVTLGDWLTGQKLTSREAAELCAKIADALHHAHEQGVVHRDLKPANIMIDYDGQPYLMDFGLARRESGEVTMTMDGQVLGTPAYMSPEQAQGEGHTADRRSDVYSLGVILFQVLTGELPFRGNARMLIKQVIHDEPPSPRKLNGNVPKDLETITLKCLEKEPNRRYRSADDLASELRRFLNGNPINARPIKPLEHVVRWYQRNSTAVITTAGAYGLITSIILQCWGLIGLALMFGGAVPGPPRAALELLVFVGTLYPLLFLAGFATIQGKLSGILGGTILSFGYTIVTFLAALKINVGILQLELMSAAQYDPFFHFELCTLLLLVSAIGATLYAIALTTKVRNILEERTISAK